MSLIVTWPSSLSWLPPICHMFELWLTPVLTVQRAQVRLLRLVSISKVVVSDAISGRYHDIVGVTPVLRARVLVDVLLCIYCSSVRSTAG